MGIREDHRKTDRLSTSVSKLTKKNARKHWAGLTPHKGKGKCVHHLPKLIKKRKKQRA